MGYLTRFTGEIRIEPPLNWSEIRNIPNQDDLDVALEFHESQTDTSEGVLTVKQAIAIVPFTDDSYRGYSMRDHIQTIMDYAPDHEYTGYILGEGEGQADIRRYIVKDGKVIVQAATFHFPEE